MVARAAVSHVIVAVQFPKPRREGLDILKVDCAVIVESFMAKLDGSVGRVRSVGMSVTMQLMIVYEEGLGD